MNPKLIAPTTKTKTTEAAEIKTEIIYKIVLPYDTSYVKRLEWVAES